MNAATPMMQQYRSIKRQHADAILFYRLGDFYEMFEGDAKIASSTLNLTLTKRHDTMLTVHPKLYSSASLVLHPVLCSTKWYTLKT